MPQEPVSRTGACPAPQLQRLPRTAPCPRPRRSPRRPVSMRSLRPSTEPPFACSGLMNSAVPRTRSVSSRSASALTCAIPKSVTSARPVPTSSRMLSGFTSRCTTPCRCAYASAQATSLMSRVASASVRGPRARTRSPSVSPSTNAITKKTNSWIWSTAKMGTMFGCESLAAVRASSRNRSRTSSCAAISGGSSFSATGRSRATSCARYTMPIPPRPSTRSRE